MLAPAPSTAESIAKAGAYDGSDAVDQVEMRQLRDRHRGRRSSGGSYGFCGASDQAQSQWETPGPATAATVVDQVETRQLTDRHRGRRSSGGSYGFCGALDPTPSQ